MDTAAPELRHATASVNGIRMHLVEAGRGELVLLLHGFPESWYSWRHQIAALAPRYRVVAPDLRGYAGTEQRGPYDTATLRRDVLALLDHLGEKRAHVVGHDWGGAIAWLLAIHSPAAVRSLAVCNMPHPLLFLRGLWRLRQLRRSWYIAFFQLPRLPERLLARSSYRRLADLIVNDCRPGTFTPEDIDVMVGTWQRHGLGGGLAWYRALLRRPHLFPSPMPVIEAPTALIWGERDRALGKELTVGTDRYVRTLAVHYLPDASHWVQQEAHEEVNALLLAHLQACRAAGSRGWSGPPR